MWNEESDKSHNNINKQSQLTVSSLHTKSSSSEFTSISNLNNLPNSKLQKILLILATLFDFSVLLAVIINSFFNKNYLLNISYIEKDKINANRIDKDYASIFTINKYMLYVILFCLLLFEFSKLVFMMFKKNCKKLSKFIYMEMGYWFIILKVFYGFNLLFMDFHCLNFYLNFVVSTVLTVFTISKKLSSFNKT